MNYTDRRRSSCQEFLTIKCYELLRSQLQGTIPKPGQDGVSGLRSQWRKYKLQFYGKTITDVMQMFKSFLTTMDGPTADGLCHCKPLASTSLPWIGTTQQENPVTTTTFAALPEVPARTVLPGDWNLIGLPGPNQGPSARRHVEAERLIRQRGHPRCNAGVSYCHNPVASITSHHV